MIDAVHEALLREGALRPVTLGGQEERLWLDCDLASLAEHRLGDRTSPVDLDDARRDAWQAGATLERASGLHERTAYERCYWLLEDGEPRGTIALATTALGGRRIHVSSLYVLPSSRGQGVGQRAMRRLMATCATQRLGVRLDTSWMWQRTVRFYLALGMWITLWKRDLSFAWAPGVPPHRIAIGAREAQLAVPTAEGERVLDRARRDGERLMLREYHPLREQDPWLGEARWQSTSTFALGLALAGWPLVRSTEAWDRESLADSGPPEALARRIATWEAWDRKNGWRVETPRIPGLSYPSWDELEAEWEAERPASTGEATG